MAKRKQKKFTLAAFKLQPKELDEHYDDANKLIEAVNIEKSSSGIEITISIEAFERLARDIAEKAVEHFCQHEVHFSIGAAGISIQDNWNGKKFPIPWGIEVDAPRFDTVTCIYGPDSAEEFEKMIVELRKHYGAP